MSCIYALTFKYAGIGCVLVGAAVSQHTLDVSVFYVLAMNVYVDLCLCIVLHFLYRQHILFWSQQYLEMHTHFTRERRIHKRLFFRQRKKMKHTWHDIMAINATYVKTQGPCSICFEDVQAHHACVLRCGHQFHKKCITTWFNNSTRCPNCRQKAPLGILHQHMLK